MTITLTIKEMFGIATLLAYAGMVGVFNPQSGFFLLSFYGVWLFILTWLKT